MIDFTAPEPADEPISVVPFPTLHADALTGVPGKIVAAVMPHTEGHPAAILVQLLAMFGAAIGHMKHVLVANTRHPTRIYPLILGKTSTGAKGTSLGVANALLGAAQASDPDAWGPPVRRVSGLSTGEGLIELVRDADPDRDVPGVADKRLLVVEEEFVGVLAAASREQNTLSARFRDAWDGNRLQTVTKKDPMTATGAHITVIGHATPGELRAKMSDAQLDGGTMNRMLPIASRRTRLLPDGGNLPDEVLAEYGPMILAAVRHACGLPFDRIIRTAPADELWKATYAELRRDRPDGPVAKMTARAAPQALRLALAYALADSSRVIDEPHMRAALAIWQYADQSAEWLFGGEIDTGAVAALHEFIATAGTAGRTRNEIREVHFQKHKPAADIDAMLGGLIKDGRIRQEREPGRGRPTTRFYTC